MCVFLSIHITHVCWWLQRPEKGIGSPGARVAVACEPPRVDAGTVAQVAGNTARSGHLSSLPAL